MEADVIQQTRAFPHPERLRTCRRQDSSCYTRNYQNKDGSLTIPEALLHYMDGEKKNFVSVVSHNWLALVGLIFEPKLSPAFQ